MSSVFFVQDCYWISPSCCARSWTDLMEDESIGSVLDILRFFVVGMI